MSGIGAFVEPLVVVALLVCGTWINRHPAPGRFQNSSNHRRISDDDAERSISPSLLATQEPEWRTRRLAIFGYEKEVTTPSTRRFKSYFLSRLLERFPFLVECWYWALIYWVYQLARAATAVWIVEGTVGAARKHALQVIAIEERLNMFFELPIQKFFLQNIFLITWINRTYSFIHIPGSIAFLIFLFYYTTTRNRRAALLDPYEEQRVSYASQRLYESRRRTMAFCNLLAFCIFTSWPCMPPRLLSSGNSNDADATKGRSYGFVDTVHGPHGEGSIWTDNRFTNKLAAMPSLHFGYSLLIGLTIATLPLKNSSKLTILPFFNRSHENLAPKIRVPSWNRVACVAIGTFYPSLILVAIIATANHFILDAVVGGMVCAAAWYGNNVMLNLLVIEDWFLSSVRIHKPEHSIADTGDQTPDEPGKKLIW